jgi:Na+/phosphate symporter
MQEHYSSELKFVTIVEKLQLAAIVAAKSFQMYLEDAASKPLSPEDEARASQLIEDVNKDLEASSDALVQDLSKIVNDLCNGDSIVRRVNQNLEDALFNPESRPGQAAMGNLNGDFQAKSASLGRDAPEAKTRPAAAAPPPGVAPAASETANPTKDGVA